MTTHTNTTLNQSDNSNPTGVWTDRIAGRYRAIPVRQLAMAWWCYRESHISFRQLRVYMAAHEMAERRRYTKPGGRTKPSYTLEELKSLVGGRGSDSADAALAADIRRLTNLGLVSVAGHAIDFAAAIDDIEIEDVSGFHAMMAKLPHPDRTVPVPRRVLRAMAAGFTRGMTAVVLATLIRSLFWHRDRGAFRVDGRTKREWIADVFGVSLRSVTEGRARLIDLGWLVPRETSQFLLNRYGAHDQINTDWSHRNNESGAGDASDAEQGGSTSPSGEIQGGVASPLNRSLPQEGNQIYNRTSARSRAGPPGVSTSSTRGRAMNGQSSRPRLTAQPHLRDVRYEDLASTERLLVLYEQAIKIGLIGASEAGRLAFFSLAERAKSRGHRAGALFFWLLRERKFSYITQHDEDEAARRIRELMNGPSIQTGQQQWGRAGQGTHPEPQPEPEFTDDERFAIACIRAANKSRIQDGFCFARAGKGWTRDRWDEAVRALDERELARLRRSHTDFDLEN